MQSHRIERKYSLLKMQLELEYFHIIITNKVIDLGFLAIIITTIRKSRYDATLK